MEGPSFWSDQEKAKGVIAELKTLNAVLKPFEDVIKPGRRPDGLNRAGRGGRRRRLRRRDPRGMHAGRGGFRGLRTAVDAGRSQRSLQRVRHDPCRSRRHRGLRLGRDADAHVHDVGRNQAVRRPRSSTAKTAAPRASHEATIHIKGDYAYGYLRGETGVHRLVRISPYDSAARRHTSFASVDVLPEVDETIDIVIRDDELKRDTFRSGGPGGQHQNKTESGVRYTHLPTGIAAESRSERSQHKNDANALALLKAKLIRMEEEKREAEYAKKYDEKGDVSFGNQIRSYVLQPYQIVKDLRTGHEVGNPRAVLDGEIDGFIEAYLRMKLAKGSTDLAKT